MFGLTSEVIRCPSGSPSSHERGKLRKGNVLTNRRPVREMIHQERSLVLPDIKTTQLVQQACDVRNPRAAVENPLSRTERRLLLRQGRLKESWTSDIEEGLKKLNGLTGCKLLVDTKHDAESVSIMDDNIVKLDKRQKSRLSKPGTDSGFFDERLDSLTSGEARTVHSPESDRCGSDQLSVASSDASPPALTKEYLETKKSAVKLSPVLKATRTETRTSTEIRNGNGKGRTHALQLTDRTTWNTAGSEQFGREPDLFSTESFISDQEVTSPFLVLPSHGQTVFSSQHSENAHEQRVQVQRKPRSCPRQDVGISVALLQNRRRLLSRRAGQNKVGSQLQATTAADTCDPLRTNRATKPKAHRTRQLSGDCRQKSEHADECPQNVEDCEVSSVSLTKESLLKVSGKQDFVDVNAKCEEWLNRWLAVNNTTTEEVNNTTMEEESFVEPC